ncbi:MAG: (d)CMP kinase [Planctomycetes bacterium]|nr:(d)CMP kinase [Planctomycetota bacterium]
MIITIDGPAGAGKSTSAWVLAWRLGFKYPLDTGAMYRAVTLAALRAGIDPADPDALARLLDGLCLEMPPGRVILDGEDITAPIRTGEVTDASRPIADSRVVRERLVLMQREIARGRDIVCEGRDQGTVVFPDAACKFFLVADPVERARRRQREMLARGETVALDELLRAQEARDDRDARRAVGPMVRAADAVTIDSTGLTLEEVVDRMEQRVRAVRGSR